MPNARRRGVSVRIFLADGTPEGLRVVEKSNWTGMALMCSRVQFPDVRERPEFGRAGVYVLVGPDDSDRRRIYIGEADVLRDRLRDHFRSKDFWTHLIVFTSKDENLNKAHVQYLEARLVEEAVAAKRAAIENGNSPQRPNLSEADRSDAESFLDEMLVIYPLLGIRAFEMVQVSAASGVAERLVLAGKGLHAEGVEHEEGFLVFKGATAAAETVPSLPRHEVEHRQELVASGVFRTGPNGLVLDQDYVFSSPSRAAAIVLGRPANGRTEWKDAHGRTLKEIQDTRVV